MTFWGKHTEEDLPAELRGKSPQEIAEALRKAEAATTAATAAETARTAAETARAAQQTELDALKARNTELEANQKPVVEQPIVQEPPTIWTDPQQFIQDQTKGTTLLALQAGIMSAKMYFMQQLSPRDVKIFKKYEKEVEQAVNAVQPHQRVMPQTWLNMLLYVKGMHDQEIAKAERDSTDFFSETPSRGVSELPAPQDKLTEEEEQICRTFHYDPVKYLENKKKGAVSQSSKGAYARYSVK
jgi:hypothetical protein